MSSHPRSVSSQKISTPAKKIASNISIKGISRDADGAMITIQYGAKNYLISLHKAVSISTEDGLVTVHFLEIAGNTVTLGVRGEKVTYTVK